MCVCTHFHPIFKENNIKKMLLKVQKSKHKPKCCPSVVLIYILRYPTYKKYVNINDIWKYMYNVSNNV